MNRKQITSLLSSPSSNPSDFTGLLDIQGYNPNAQMPSLTDRMMLPTPQVGLSESELQRLAEPQPTLLGRVGQGASNAGRGLLSNIGDAYNKFTTGPYAKQRLSGIRESMSARTDRPMSYIERLSKGLNLGEEREQAQRKLDLEKIRKEQELKIKQDAALNVKKGSYPATYVTPDKKLIETYFNPMLGQRLVQGTDEPVPTGSMRLSELDVPTYKDMLTLEDQLGLEKSTMTAVDKYIQDVKTAPEGVKRIISSVKSQIYSFMDKEGLTEEDLATPRGRARLQGLIGQFRVDIVGPGVMTEQDAVRILIALGGDMSAFTPKVITIQLMEELKDKAERRYETKATRFNNLLKAAPPTSTVSGVFNRIELGETPGKSSDKAPKVQERDSRGRLKGSSDSSSGAIEEITMDMLR